LINTQLIASGPVEEVFTEDNLRKAYQKHRKNIERLGGVYEYI
jgi:ABC-type Mn2+/Zn2+ transport system ATPase subunit